MDGSERLGHDAGDLDLILADRQALEGMELMALEPLMDGELGPETLDPWVTKALSGAGEIRVMPLYFTVRTLMGCTGALGVTRSWTPEQFAEVVSGLGDRAVLRYSNAYDLLGTLTEQAGAYVEDFGPLIRAAACQPVTDEAMYALKANQAESMTASLLDGSLLLEAAEISHFSDLTAWDAAMEGKAVMKGYPVSRGNGGLLVPGEEASLAIPAASGHGAESWQFLKYLMTGDGLREYVESMGFPVVTSHYEAMEQDAIRGITEASGSGTGAGGLAVLDGKTYEVRALTEEQAEDFRDYLRDLSGLQDPGDPETPAQARAALKAVLEQGADPAQAAKGIGK